MLFSPLLNHIYSILSVLHFEYASYSFFHLHLYLLLTHLLLLLLQHPVDLVVPVFILELLNLLVDIISCLSDRCALALTLALTLRVGVGVAFIAVLRLGHVVGGAFT